MSKASEWAKASPMGTKRGGATIKMHGGRHMLANVVTASIGERRPLLHIRSMVLTEAEALALAQWLLAAFGEDPSNA